MVGTAQSFSFGTKAETLMQLSRLLCSGTVLPLEHFTNAEWRSDPEAVLDRVCSQEWARSALVVRSSACTEDTGGASNAGRYLSQLQVRGRNRLREAIEAVFDSYEVCSPEDQVLVQPQMEGVEVKRCGFVVRGKQRRTVPRHQLV
jgi:hypothetical protein